MKEGEGILEEALQERRREATPWVKGEQRREEDGKSGPVVTVLPFFSFSHCFFFWRKTFEKYI